jgi:hypothetical protein
LREKWESEKLAYVGDKAPFYVRQLPYLRETFPGARFIVVMRDPVSVADSYERRARDPSDHWPSANGHTLAIEHWNQSAKSLLRYLERFGLQDVFIIEYESFFSGDQGYLRSLYRFLGLDVTHEVAEEFESMTAGWAGRKGRAAILDGKMEAEVRASADWESYLRIMGLLPLMQDYHLLASERNASARTDNLRAKDTIAYRQLHNLSRYLYLKLREAGRDGLGGDLAEADRVWQSFWSL